MIYLDNSATTPVCKESAASALYYMTEEFFNPSASYAPAVQVERKVNETRSKVAQQLGVAPNEIYFTGGGTESNNIAVLGTAAFARPGTKLITTGFEHPSVAEVFSALEESGAHVARVSLDEAGNVDYNQLAYELNDTTVLVSVMHVNNEVGSVMDLAKIAALIKQRAPRARFHSDGVQAFMKLPAVPVPCDMYSLSGHKFHAPKGVGALMMRSHVKNAGGQMGGGQERGMRSGTVNAAGIIAMGEAILSESAQQRASTRMLECKLRLANNLAVIPDMFINGPEARVGAPHILNVSFMGVRGETLLHALEERGIYISVGSACSARKPGKNRVLEAIGLNASRIDSAVRISLSRINTPDEMDAAAQTIAELVASLRRYQRR